MWMNILSTGYNIIDGLHYQWVTMGYGGRSKYQVEPYGLSNKIHNT